jgi:hypothetical protein
MSEKTQPKAYRFPDFCKAFGIGETKGRELIRDGALKAKRNGRYLIVTEEAAQAWLESLPAAA